MSEWQPITAKQEGKRLIVTNNPTALNAHGEMSHLWIGLVIKSGEPKKYGKWVTFDSSDRMIWGITHWWPLPESLKP